MSGSRALLSLPLLHEAFNHRTDRGDPRQGRRPLTPVSPRRLLKPPPIVWVPAPRLLSGDVPSSQSKVGHISSDQAGCSHGLSKRMPVWNIRAPNQCDVSCHRPCGKILPRPAAGPLCAILIPGPRGPSGSEARERGTAVVDITPRSRHVLRVTGTQMAQRPPSPRLSFPCRVGNGLELAIRLMQEPSEEWRDGDGGLGRPHVPGQLTRLLEAEACAGRVRPRYSNSWGYWVLYAKAGQIFLNVPGQMEAQSAAG